MRVPKAERKEDGESKGIAEGAASKTVETVEAGFGTDEGLRQGARIDAQLLHPGNKGGAFDSQKRCSAIVAAYAALGVRQDPHDAFPVGGIGVRSWRRHGSRAFQFAHGDFQYGAARQDDGAFNEILQLADI